MSCFTRRDWRSATIGLLVGLGIAFALGADGAPGAGRYQLEVWESGNSSEHGAYRLDTVTGEVHVVSYGGNVHKITFPEPERPKK
jgi:hypothetical protein